MNIPIFAASATPLIIAIVQVAKSAGFPKRYAPLLALGIGLVLGLVAALATLHPDLDPLIKTATLGIMAGLAASGAYDAVHETTK